MFILNTTIKYVDTIKNKCLNNTLTTNQCNKVGENFDKLYGLWSIFLNLIHCKYCNQWNHFYLYLVLGSGHQNFVYQNCFRYESAKFFLTDLL